MELKTLTEKPRFIIYAVSSFVLFLLLWSLFATIDQVVVGIGKVHTETGIQSIQSLEGGIIREILIEEGDRVETNQPLIKLDDIAFRSALKELEGEIESMVASQAQLQAELAATKDMRTKRTIKRVDLASYLPDNLSTATRNNAQSGYETALATLDSEASTVLQRVKQAEESVKETRQFIVHLKTNLDNLQQELAFNEKAFDQGAISGVEILQLNRSVTDMEADLQRNKSELEQKEQQLQEFQFEYLSLTDRFRLETRYELNRIEADLLQRESNRVAMNDRVFRTTINSPVIGTVKLILNSTTGGIVKSGDTIMEIVPDDANLIIQVDVNPKDVGFLRPGLRSVIKLSAYDFVVYGGIEGKLTHISADTLLNDKGEAFYIAWIEFESNTTQSGKAIDIIPGMQAEVDIIIGNKTIFEYWLNPILRAKQKAMREI